MKNIFSQGLHIQIEKDIKNFLISSAARLPQEILDNPRSVGDRIQDLLRHNLAGILGDIAPKYLSSFSRQRI